MLQSDIASAVLGCGGQPGGHLHCQGWDRSSDTGSRAVDAESERRGDSARRKASENESQRPAVWGLTDLENGKFSVSKLFLWLPHGYNLSLFL